MAACLLLLPLTSAANGQSRRPGLQQQPPQQLPLEAQWCLETRACILLEVADQPEEQRLGLQLRGRLDRLRGMWFPFTPAQVLRFWMHRTPQPLDMVFIRGGRVLAIQEAAAPCPHLPCRSYGPEGVADGVVELAAGEAARLGITVGSAVLIRPLGPRR